MLKRSAVACLIALVGACADADHGIGPVDVSETRSEASINAQDGPRDLEAIEQFSVNVEQVTPIRPGAVTVRVRVQANHGTPSATLRVSFPDVDAAKMANWNQITRYPSRGTTPAHTETLTLANAEVVEREITVVIPREGNYRVVATVQASHPTDVPSGTFQNTVHRIAWLTVQTHGGRLTDGLHRRPGQRYPRPGPQIDASVGSQPAPSSASRMSGDLMVASGDYADMQVVYLNADSSNVPTPLVGASVYRRIWNEYEARYVYEGWAGITDANGRFLAECPTDFPPYMFERYEYSIYAIGGSIELERYTPLATFDLRDGDPWCGAQQQFTVNASLARLFSNLRIASQASASLLGYGSPAQVVSLTNDNSHYSRWTGGIYINPAHIWGEFGIFTASHEFGHAVHHEILGGNEGGGCPDPHYIDLPSNKTCAFSEGFANFHAAATMGTRAGYYYSVIANPTYGAGTDVEGNVGAFFFDLVDDASPLEGAEGHDATAYGGKYLADIIKTCRVLFGGWHRPNSVDWLIYCIERTTSISPPPGYPNDFPYVSAYSESAAEPGGSPPTGWSAAAIRDNWEWNLYRIAP